MNERKHPPDHDRSEDDTQSRQTDDIIEAFERVRSESRELSKHHTEATKDAYRRDRQVLIERRRHPR